MINALKLCSLALNPNSPSPFASMVKVEDGMMIAYGGLLCIRVPVSQDIGAAFDPKSLATFFRKERPQVAYTVKHPKLTLSDKKERLTVNCLPAEDLQTIDNIETPTPCVLNKKSLKIAAELIDTANTRPFALGVAFRDGVMMSTNNAVFFMAEGPEGDFNIPKEAALAICKFKSDVVAISKNNHTVKFIFADGSSLCTHLISEPFPDIDFLFDGDWQSFSVSPEVKDIDCDSVEISGTAVRFLTDSSVGELEDAVTGTAEIKCKKKYLDYLLAISSELEYIPKQRVKVVGENCVMISSMITK